MSTVLAIVRRDGETVASHEIDEMLSVLRERPSDGQGIWHRGCAILAHQHLWITPEELGETQPHTIANNRYVISFDGRLDNRSDLLQRLKLSHQMSAPVPDAQIALHAYLTWGEKCTGELLGDFAFVIWDAVERQLFIARDPLGVRQIAYYCDAKRCIVASTVAPIIAHPEIVPEINDGMIAEYIADYELNQEETFFRNIYFCPPAHHITVSENWVRKRRYWSPTVQCRIYYDDPQAYVEEFQDLFSRSVAARLRSHGEIGIFLSSGIDSSSVAAMAHDQLFDRGSLPINGLNTYTLSFESLPESDEQQYVREYAEHYNLDNNFIPGDRIPLLDRIPVPYMTPDYLCCIMTDPLTHEMIEYAQRDSIRVVLHGAYADTLFSPQRYWAEDVVKSRWTPLVSRLLEPHQRIQAEFEVAEQLARSFARPLKRRFWGGLGKLGTADVRSGLEKMQPTLAQVTSIEERIQQNPLKEFFSNQTYLQCATTMHWNYFIRAAAGGLQRFSSHGMEGWDPFRDRRLVEYLLAIPTYIAGRPGSYNNKWLLRESIAGLVPENTRQRPPHPGASSWSNAWFASEEGKKVINIKQDPLVIQYGYYQRGWLEGRLNEQAHRPQYDYDLWQCVSLEYWLRSFAP